MKAAVALAAAALLSIGAIGGVVAWRHAHPSEFETELVWLESFVAWARRIDAALEQGNTKPVLGCERDLLRLTGRARTATMTKAEQTALGGCRTLRRGYVEALGTDDEYLPEALVANWDATRYSVLADLRDNLSREAHPESSAAVAAKAAPYAGTSPAVFCWPEHEWDQLRQEWLLIRGQEFWVTGYADWDRNHINLDPAVCEPLELFFGGDYSPSLNLQSFELAEALVTLAHEAEHLRSPKATEAEVECVALQRVRDLVRDAGRGRAYEDLMAGLAWDVGYPRNLPQYRTNFCRDGGPLDVRPDTDVWP